MEELGFKLMAAVPVVGAVIYALITITKAFLKHINENEERDRAHREACEKRDREYQSEIREDHRASLERVCLSHEKCSSEMVAKLGDVHTDIRVIAEAAKRSSD